MEFLDRRAELGWLEEAWGSDRPQLRILYGRRRVGKSRLLDEFAHGKRAIVYQAVEGTTGDHLRDLTTRILELEDDPVLRAGPLPGWDAALAYLARLARSGRLLFVFDEYQYAAQADPTLASRLQRWWSRDIADLPIYVVLCGSYVRFFVKNVLTGPLFGRNTGVWQLTPLGYREAGEFFPDWSPEDRVRAYAVVGGVPHYILQFDPARSLGWNLARNLLRRGAMLYQEAELVMREELREPRVYYSILRAIDEGCTTNARIEQRVYGGERRAHLTAYLDTLRELGFVEQRSPVVGGVRRSIWTIADPYLRFWFRFVLPNRAELDRTPDVDAFHRAVVAPRLDEFVSRPAFEEVCRAWVGRRIDEGAFGASVGPVGAWWGPIPAPAPGQPRRQAEAEVEVVAAREGRVFVLGEAKWTSAPVDLVVLNRLRRVARHVPGADAETRLILFGRRFDARLREAADKELVALVGPEELYA
jgi:hypothetical protein